MGDLEAMGGLEAITCTNTEVNTSSFSDFIVQPSCTGGANVYLCMTSYPIKVLTCGSLIASKLWCNI